MLEEIRFRGGVSVSSDYAKRHVPEVAMFASLGLITTEMRAGKFGRKWRLTTLGIVYLEGQR